MAFVAGPIFAGITRPLRIDKSLTVGRGIFYAMGSLVSGDYLLHIPLKLHMYTSNVFGLHANLTNLQLRKLPKPKVIV